jgi:hypothetical protein
MRLAIAKHALPKNNFDGASDEFIEGVVASVSAKHSDAGNSNESPIKHLFSDIQKTDSPEDAKKNMDSAYYKRADKYFESARGTGVS